MEFVNGWMWQKQILEPAIQGTVNVLEAAKEAGAERVVATSSISAIVPSPNWPADKIKTEDCWTDLDYCKSNAVCTLIHLFHNLMTYLIQPHHHHKNSVLILMSVL